MVGYYCNFITLATGAFGLLNIIKIKKKKNKQTCLNEKSGTRGNGCGIGTIRTENVSAWRTVVETIARIALIHSGVPHQILAQLDGLSVHDDPINQTIGIETDRNFLQDHEKKMKEIGFVIDQTDGRVEPKSRKCIKFHWFDLMWYWRTPLEMTIFPSAFGWRILVDCLLWASLRLVW